MPIGKIKMEKIHDEKIRKKTFERRRKSLMKKASELSILCGVDTSLIVYENKSSKPQVWPENSNECKRILSKYVKSDRRKPTIAGQSGSQRNGVKDAEYVNRLSKEELEVFSNALDSKIDLIKHKINSLKAVKTVKKATSNSINYEEQQHRMDYLTEFLMLDPQVEDELSTEEMLSTYAEFEKILSSGEMSSSTENHCETTTSIPLESNTSKVEDEQPSMNLQMVDRRDVLYSKELVSAACSQLDKIVSLERKISAQTCFETEQSFIPHGYRLGGYTLLPVYEDGQGNSILYNNSRLPMWTEYNSYPHHIMKN